MPEFQVKYALKAVIGVTVRCKDFEEAKNKASIIINKNGYFTDEVEYIDGNVKYIGIDNMDDWNTEF